MILIGFAFLAGIVTIASPCILPLLPIVLSGSAGSGKLRPYGIVAGFIVTFTVVTLTFSILVQATGLSPNALRWAAVVMLAAFGLVMLVPRFQLWFESLAGRLATAGHRVQAAASAGSGAVPSALAAIGDAPTQVGSGRRSNGFVGGLIVGVTLGLVWTPCVGPIMASVITLAATGALSATSIGVTIAYALGTGIPMLLLIIGGKAIVSRLSGIKKAGLTIQRIFAGLMIVVAAAIALNLDRQFQSFVLDTFPGLATSLTSIEESDLVADELDRMESMR
jgi:cytochrome c biogenesis protein CcdA